jgi:hypothetical protein
LVFVREVLVETTVGQSRSLHHVCDPYCFASAGTELLGGDVKNPLAALFFVV